MLQRICPVCDQKMKFAHYCTNCRSWVSHPWTREVDYYLNERHPAGETSCTYHQPETPGRSQPSPRPASRPGNAQGKTKNPKLVILILILIMVIRIIAELGASLVSSVSQKIRVPEYDIDLGMYGTEEYEYSYEGLTDEEARAAGSSCNGSTHFGIQGEDVEQVIRGAAFHSCESGKVGGCAFGFGGVPESHGKRRTAGTSRRL